MFFSQRLYQHQYLWFFLRAGMFVATLFLFAGLWMDTRIEWLAGLSVRELFWIVLIPVIVLTIYFAPMLWRNICPLATTNLWYFSLFGRRKLSKEGILANQRRGLVGKIYAYLRKNGLLISALLFWTLVPLRLVWFNGSSELTFWLLLGVFAAAFIMGYFFPVKSGWCTSICPLSAVEKVYGMNPALHFSNTRCHFNEPHQKKVLSCSGCSLNCPDVREPEHSYWQANTNKVFYSDVNSKVRKFFLATLPAFLLAYYLVSSGSVSLPEALPAKLATLYAFFIALMLPALGLYTLVKKILRARVVKRVGELSLERPSALYALYKRRLDMVVVVATLNLIWLLSAYVLVQKVIVRVFDLQATSALSLWLALSIVFFLLSLFNLKNSWKETFLPGHYRPSWW